MTIERKTKTFTYKQAEISPFGGKTLQILLTQALEKLATVGERSEKLSPDDETPIWRLIGDTQVNQDFVFGIFIRFSPGTNPVFLIDDKAAASITVEHLAAPVTDDGKRRELIESILYFGVTGNHLVLLQSPSLRSRQIEEHFRWLLRKSRALDDSTVLKLLDQPPLSVRQKIEKSKVKAISVTGDLTRPEDKHKRRSDEVTGVNLARFSDELTHSISALGDVNRKGTISAIRSLMGVDASARIDFDQLDGANLEYVLQLKYRKKTTESGQRAMDILGDAFRHAEDIDAKVLIKGGGSIHGSEFKLSGPVTLKAYDGIFSQTEVFEAIRMWLLEKLNSGDVEA